MARTSPQFTPTQILAAGERAEAEGQRDYAVQFYRHLVEHHTASVEALIARNGLDRLEPTRVSLTSLLDDAGQRSWNDPVAQQDWPRTPPMHAEADYGRQYEADPVDNGSGYAAPASSSFDDTGTEHADWRAGETARPDWPPHAAVRSEPEPVPRIAQARPEPLPPVPRPFLAGRVLAAVLSGVGFVAVPLALAVLATGLVAPDQIIVLSRSLGPWSAMPLSGMGATLMLGTGLLSLLVGQLAGALFAIAGASRDTAALLRHEATHGRAAGR